MRVDLAVIKSWSDEVIISYFQMLIAMEKLRIAEAEAEKLIKASKEWVKLLRMNRSLGACKFPEFVPFVRRTL